MGIIAFIHTECWYYDDQIISNVCKVINNVWHIKSMWKMLLLFLPPSWWLKCFFHICVLYMVSSRESPTAVYWRTNFSAQKSILWLFRSLTYVETVSFSPSNLPGAKLCIVHETALLYLLLSQINLVQGGWSLIN